MEQEGKRAKSSGIKKKKHISETNNFVLNAYFVASAARARNKPMNDHTRHHTQTQNVFPNFVVYYTRGFNVAVVVTDRIASAAATHSGNRVRERE